MTASDVIVPAGAETRTEGISPTVDNRAASCRHMTAEEHAIWHWQVEPTTEIQQLAYLLARWRLDPIMGAIEAFRVVLHPYQAQILLDVWDAPAEIYAFYGLEPGHAKRQVLVPSGHGLGKTRVLAIATWLHLLTHRFSKTLLTAPTSDQLSSGVWREVRKLYRRLKRAWPMLADEWEILGASIVHQNPEFADWQAIARTARAEKPEGLQGAHGLDVDDEFGDLATLFGDEEYAAAAGGMLVIVEEASGVEDEIRKVLEGALSEEGARFLAVGNPTRPDGWFAEGLDNMDRYAVHCLDCRMSNREQVYRLPYRDFGGRTHQLRIRGFVQPRYWETILAECGGDEDADYFRVRVAGRKPRSAFEQVIRTHWIEQAQARMPHAESYAEPAVIGLDFGLAADKHALAVRQGHNVLDGYEWLPKDSPQEVTLDAAERAIEVQQLYPRTRYIIGDGNGVGRGAMEYLARYYRERPELNVTVIIFNAGERALDHKRYYRRRDEMWFRHGRPFFADVRTYVPALPGLAKQLCIPGYHEDTNKKIAVESKDDVRKRTGEPSGNLADAILQTLLVRVLHERPQDKPAPTHPKVFDDHFKRWTRQQYENADIR